MAKSHITIATAGFGRDFKSRDSFNKNSLKGSFASTIAAAGAGLANQSIREMTKIKETSSISDSDKIVIKRTQKQNANKKIQNIAWTGNEKGIGIEHKGKKDKSVTDETMLIAKTFYRLVCRTPYDEDYYYTMYEKYVRGNAKTILDNAHIMKHKADDDVVKQDWHMSFKIGLSKYEYSVKDFSDIEFEEAFKPNFAIIAYRLNEVVQGRVMQDIRFWNTNPRVDQLEFGLYKKKTSNELKSEAHVGEHREHGTYAGYSVQAPRGFITLTLKEVEQAVITATERSDDPIVKPYDLTFNGIFNADQKLAEYIAKNKKLKNSKGGYSYIEEKDILNSLSSNKQSLNIPIDVSYKELVTNYKAEITRYLNNLKSQLKKEEKTREINNTRQKRHRQKEKKEKLALETGTLKEYVWPQERDTDLSYYEELADDSIKDIYTIEGEIEIIVDGKRIYYKAELDHGKLLIYAGSGNPLTISGFIEYIENHLDIVITENEVKLSFDDVDWRKDASYYQKWRTEK